jgi:hypothetical protein
MVRNSGKKNVSSADVSSFQCTGKEEVGTNFGHKSRTAYSPPNVYGAGMTAAGWEDEAAG